MKVHEYAKQSGKKTADVLAAINAINGEIPEDEEPVIKAGNANSTLMGDETDMLDSYFGFTVEDPNAPKKRIPLHEIEVIATRLKGKGPALIRDTKIANDEQDAVRQLISERGIKPSAYRFRSRRVKELGDHVRTKGGELVPAA